MLRRVNLVILLGLIIVLVLSFGVSASAEPGNGGDEEASLAQSEFLQPQDELAQVQRDAVVAAEEYNEARSQIDQLNREIAETVVKQADAETNFEKAQASLEKQAVSVYKAGPLHLLDFLFSAETFSDFANRLWFSIKALLGRADDVENWKKQSNELEQIQVDLKSHLQEKQQVADDAEQKWDAALANGEALQQQIDQTEDVLPQDGSGVLPQEDPLQEDPLIEDSLSQGNPGLSPQQRLDTAQGIAEGIQQMPAATDPMQSDALNQEPLTTEIPDRSQEAVQNMGIPPEEASGVQDTLTDTIQAGSDAQAAQKQANDAARNLAEEVARLNSSPSGDPPLGGANQAAPSPGSGSQVAPSNNGNGTIPTTPSVSANPGLLDLANQFQAARDEEQRRIADAQKQSQELAGALERALQPAAGTQTNPANAANQGASANGIQPKGTQPGTSANPRPSGGGSGLGAAGLAASRLGAPYAMGAEGPDAYSCTGLMRAIARDMGWPEPSWNPDDYRGYTPAGGPVPGSVATFPGGVGMVGADGNIIHANHATGSVTSLPPDVLGVDGYYIPPGWSV